MKKQMIDLSNNFEARVRFDVETIIEIAAYEQISQYYSSDDKCWVQREPSYVSMDISNIIGFHDATEKELHESVCTGVKFPTEFCTMRFYDKDNKTLNSRNGISLMFVAGSAKDNEKKLNKLRENHNKIIEKYYKDTRKLADEYCEIMNAGD